MKHLNCGGEIHVDLMFTRWISYKINDEGEISETVEDTTDREPRDRIYICRECGESWDTLDELLGTHED